MRSKDLLSKVRKKLIEAEEYESLAFSKIAVLFLETHNVSYDEGCVFVETEENIRKWKAISMRMMYAYDKCAYARAYREIYSEIQNLINSK